MAIVRFFVHEACYTYFDGKNYQKEKCMIILKNYKELEKFKKVIPADKNNGQCGIILYNITENGNPADVVFNFAFNCCYMLNKNNSLDDNIDYSMAEYKIIAKNITFNYFIKVDCIEAENIAIKKSCEVKHIKAINKITGFKIIANNIIAKNIMCNRVYVSWIYCKNLQCKLLSLSDKEFKDIAAKNIKSCGGFKEDYLPF